MIKYTLRKIDNSYLLTSNEEIKENDYYYEPTSEEPFNIAWKNFDPNYYQFKVIAKTNFYYNSNLPSIDFSLLSELECKTIKYIDVNALADRSSEVQEATYTPQNKVTYMHGYTDGFRAAQKMMRFSKQDLADYLNYVEDNFYFTDSYYDRDTGKHTLRTEILEKYLNSLDKVKEWNVEVDFSNESAKITKLL